MNEVKTISWTRMEEGTAEDYQLLAPLSQDHLRSSLVDNLVGLLRLLQGPKLGYQVDRYTHSLQTATRALRDNERLDLVVGALLHDVGDAFAPENHSVAAASILAPYVDEQTHWVVKHHGAFQGYYFFHHLGGNRSARDEFRESPHYDACEWFCAEYDQNSFDPAYDTLPIEEFMPMMREVFERPSSLGFT